MTDLLMRRKCDRHSGDDSFRDIGNPSSKVSSLKYMEESRLAFTGERSSGTA
jgi:hypothetical protein